MIEIEIDFRDQAALDRYAREGWGTAEAFGTWMTGARSELVLPPPPRSDAPLIMQALIGPLLIPGAVEQQRLRILVNGFVVTAVHMTQLHQVNCEIPAGAVQGAAALEIVFEHPDAACPADYDMGEDARALAGSIWSLTLLAASPLPHETGPMFEPPVFHTRMRGNLGDRMIQHMVALSVQARAPHTRLTGALLPEGGIVGAPDDGVWADWAETAPQDVDLNLIANILNGGLARRVVHRGLGQRISHFLPRWNYRDVFYADAPELQGFDAQHLVINIGTDEMIAGQWADHVLLPVAFYRELVNQTGLIPVFTGQTDANAYTDALRQEFPDAIFLGSLGPIDDFEIVRRSANIVVAVNTLSWLAAWLSDAQQIFLPVSGLFNPMQVPEVDLLPMMDPRYRFFLFPVNHATADFAASHAEMAGQWREISEWDAAELRRSIPFPAPAPLNPASLIEWEPEPLIPGPPPVGAVLPEDLADLLEQSENAARGGYLLDALQHLRRIPLIDFTRLLWSMPREDMPALSQLLPRMPENSVQSAYTGRAGEELVLLSVELSRILEQQFRQITGRELRHASVLDYGCGWGRMLRLMWHVTDPERCYGVDTDAQAIHLCRTDGMKGSFAVISPTAQRLPVEGRRFDLILAYSVFTHTPPALTAQTLATLRRHIRPNGVLALTIRPAEFWALSGVPEAEALLQTHRTEGAAYRSLGIVSPDGAEFYGDTSFTIPHLASLAPDWEVAAADRGMDSLETIVFLTPR